jgi:hypothetical protein
MIVAAPMVGGIKDARGGRQSEKLTPSGKGSSEVRAIYAR